GQIKHLVQSNEERFVRMQETTVLALDKIRGEVDKRLQSMQTDNNQALDKMRHTVDEKLHQTLEERLGRSFKLVSDHLEKVQRGLGEMQSLAAGVGDLRKVLSNVKTRGILGEIQLLNIIEEMMTPDQYSLNVATVPGRESRVEVAIKFPGRGKEESIVYLPIDSKFPMDRYQVLLDAYESSCPDQVQQSTKELSRALITCGKEIRKKYISAPYTTDFAIMFLPVEGLYAEVSRQTDLLYRLRTEYNIMVAGPSNLSAFLSSLQMGFRTLAIEKRSSEVWALLSEIKTEFGKFGIALDKVQKKIKEANSAIDQAGVRSRAIKRRLNKVEELPDSSEQLALST
ncbi:MAG: DNA recombination protein RmuC, partial [Saprospiraceae bacterium]|nr:DNA recombination protein RmuC [Saprospiraceae bacterium]